MIPILRGEDLQEFDNNLKSTGQIQNFIRAAGYAAYVRTLQILKNPYGKRVVVVAGPGHNGDDGRVLASYLKRNYIKVAVIPTDSLCEKITGVDLIVDAAFGTGLKRPYKFFSHEQIPILSIDVPTGLNCDDGTVFDGALKADYTVSFVALKPGFYFNQGPEYAGSVFFENLSADLHDVNTFLYESSDIRSLTFKFNKTDHKWKHAGYVIAGSENMMGAAKLTCDTAIKTGASIVKVLSLNTAKLSDVTEVIHQPFDGNWDQKILNEIDRFKVLSIGPGLVLGSQDINRLENVLTKVELPIVLDASALNAIGGLHDPKSFLKGVKAVKILTPHAKEFATLLGLKSYNLTYLDVKKFASDTNSIVLLKGSTTTVSSPTGKTFFINSGSPILATAGTGDVLTGLITGLVARSEFNPASHIEAESFDRLTQLTAAAAYIHSVGFNYLNCDSDTLKFGFTSSKLIDGVVGALNTLVNQPIC